MHWKEVGSDTIRPESWHLHPTLTLQLSGWCCSRAKEWQASIEHSITHISKEQMTKMCALQHSHPGFRLAKNL